MLWMLTLVLPMCCQCVANVFANVPGGCDAVDAHSRVANVLPMCC